MLNAHLSSDGIEVAIGHGIERHYPTVEKEVAPTSYGVNQRGPVDRPFDSDTEIHNAITACNRQSVIGMKKNSFWIVLVLVGITVVAAAVGGAIGGASAAAKSKSKAATITIL